MSINQRIEIAYESKMAKVNSLVSKIDEQKVLDQTKEYNEKIYY